MSELDESREGIVYIAGPMRGLKDFNYSAFDKAEELLIADGYTKIFNPANNFGRRTDLSGATYLRKAICQVAKSDIVVFLPGWMYSTGAMLEKNIAEHLGLQIMFAADLWPVSLDELAGRSVGLE